MMLDEHCDPLFPTYGLLQDTKSRDRGEKEERKKEKCC